MLFQKSGGEDEDEGEGEEALAEGMEMGMVRKCIFLYSHANSVWTVLSQIGIEDVDPNEFFDGVSAGSEGAMAEQRKVDEMVSASINLQGLR